MMISKQYQVTIYNEDNKYKPISTIVTIRQQENITLGDTQHKRYVIQQGIQKICNKKYWTTRDMNYYRYTKVRVREYTRVEK